jgi:hypothetical protein
MPETSILKPIKMRDTKKIEGIFFINWFRLLSQICIQTGLKLLFTPYLGKTSPKWQLLNILGFWADSFSEKR